MNNTEIAEAIAYLLPNPQLAIIGHSIDDVVWLDERPMPSKTEIEKTVKDLIVIKKAESEAKLKAKQNAEAKLAALGLTSDDLKALGL